MLRVRILRIPMIELLTTEDSTLVEENADGNNAFIERVFIISPPSVASRSAQLIRMRILDLNF